MSIFFAMQNRLFQQIDKVHHVIELMPLLQLVDVEDVRQFLKQRIQTERAVPRSYASFMPAQYEFMSISDILPAAMMSHVLSFVDRHQHQTVCKKWRSILSHHDDIDKSKRYGSNPVKLVHMTFLEMSGHIVSAQNDWFHNIDLLVKTG